MKTSTIAITFSAAFCLGTLAFADRQEGSGWFDMQHCAICKHMGEHEDLMTSMKWETHSIDNGMLSVATIPEKHKAMMQECHQAMKATVDQLKAGKQMELCGFCKSQAALLKKGAKEQTIETSFGMVSLLTSDDPEVIQEIQDHAKRTTKEYESMMKAKAEGSTE